MPEEALNREVEHIIALALREDIGDGDITTQAIYTGRETAEAEFIAKEDGIVAGIELASLIFQKLDDDISFRAEVQDGHQVKRGQLIATAKGAANVLLTGERTVLNFMQRMSGVATQTARYVEAVAHTQTRILDTRKTLPGHRFLDKWAVRLGGGHNHRFRLDDMFLIKENHIAVAGGIPQAIQACRRFRDQKNQAIRIEIEVETMEQVDMVLEHGGVDVVMLDNFSLLQLEEAVARIAGRFETEASGNVTLKTVAEIAETGVTYISSGALTHSVKALDISLLFS